MMEQRIFFLHVSKTAGASLKAALSKKYVDSDVCPYIFEWEIINDSQANQKYKFFAAHCGFNTAKDMGCDLITILRDPVERLESLYNFWHQRVPEIDPGGVFEFVRQLSFEEFLKSSDKRLIPDRNNGLTYQLAYSNLDFGRDRLKKMTDEELIRLAFHNLKKFKVVGFQNNLNQMLKLIKQKFKIDINLKKENVTKHNYIIDRKNINLMNSIYRLTFFTKTLDVKDIGLNVDQI